MKQLDAFVVGYDEGNQVVHASAVATLLKGEIEAPGKLPVRLAP